MARQLLTTEAVHNNAGYTLGNRERGQNTFGSLSAIATTFIKKSSPCAT
jgi:hypothetical protein